MILINKSLQVQNIVLTLFELTTIVNPVYLLVLTNDFDRKKTSIILNNNLSPNLNRYDHFTVNTSLISGLDTGLYSYAIFQSDAINYDDSVLGEPNETGRAKVIAPDELVSPIIYKSDTPSGYITYKSTNE